MKFLDSPVIAQLDSSVDSAFEPLRKNDDANRLFYGLSEAANHSILWHGVAWGRALIFKSRRKDAVIISALLGVESALVNGPVKMFFRRERPEITGPRPMKLRQPRTSSFPSGHATSAFCAATLLSRRTKIKPLYFGLAGLVAMSRIHVKIHHASDVLGGAIIGLAFGKFTKRIVPGSSKN